MKPRFFLLLPLLFPTACSDTEQPRTVAVSPSTFDAEQFDELKNQIARLANQNAGFAADAAEMKRLQDEINHLKVAESPHLQPAVEVCQ
ncbi:plasmid mobilization relaxosome protein MobC [Phyllobacterium myrsinacearum]|uniref:Uncharacterized protein n=1 Tax=Phyllobacterium myrsinacearum TaxID=28101 RepID=A0A839EGZ9_9HYPH|nr:plasmid mobilization relaxosome protein MobC [Phyllobacterium myrsinacearum]MBA8876844.1 hypothetical protein [Phyllobacterium myrsinacearum]